MHVVQDLVARGMTALQECKVTRGGRGERIGHFSVGSMHIILGAQGSRGSSGIALPAEVWAGVDGVLPQARVVAVRLKDGGARTACASVHLPPSGCTKEAFERAFGDMTAAVTWGRAL